MDKNRGDGQIGWRQAQNEANSLVTVRYPDGRLYVPRSVIMAAAAMFTEVLLTPVVFPLLENVQNGIVPLIAYGLPPVIMGVVGHLLDRRANRYFASKKSRRTGKN